MRLPARALIGFLVFLVPGPGSAASDARAIEEPKPRIVAVGDVHGSPDAFSRVLRAAGLVDETGNWIGGNAILVQTGDLTDRGPGVREVLDLMRDLERSAAEDGGQVVSLLGNHEVYNLIGLYDYQSTPLAVFGEIAAAFRNSESEKTRKRTYKQWSSWAKEYSACAVVNKVDWMARNPLGFVEYQEAMSPRGEYGRWLRARKIVVNIQGTLFLHGGLSPELPNMEVRSLDSINAKAAAELEQFDRDRELLEKQGVIARYATLSEVHCAVAYELKALGEGVLDGLATLRRERLEEVQNRLPSGENWLLLDPRGPVWFRGYAKWSDEEAETGLATVFGTFGGARVVVGHTPQPGAIVARFDQRVFLIDTAMAYPESKGRAAALEIRGDVISTIDEGGRVSLTGPEPANPITGSNGHGENATELTEAGATSSLERNWLAEDGSPLPFVDDAAVLDFLKTARVVEKARIGKGVTRARILVLEKDGIRARAAFHDVDVTKKRHRTKAGLVTNFRDSYLNNVAAYELGRLLGVTNLTPTTLRKVGGARGSIQLWVEKAIDEAQRRERGLDEAMSVRSRRRIADMWVFDNLINNIDRSQGNMLHDSRGEFWMIDHTRSFIGFSRLPSPAKMRRCSRELLAAIRSLDEDQTRERLRPYLSSFEIKSLFARREKLLGYLDERIAAQGESSFLFSYADVDDAVTVSYEADDIPASADDS